MTSSTKTERGSALIPLIVMMVTVGGLVLAHLGEVTSEKRRVQAQIRAERATQRALGELARARNVVNASKYDANGQNLALKTAIGSNPAYVPGTQVLVRRTGLNSNWFVLEATGEDAGTIKTAQTLCRQNQPVTAYNFFVVDHPLGVSGAPRGEIHSNKQIEFWFPNGRYVDGVTAAGGFAYKAGATPQNTQILGQSNAHAATQNILKRTSLSDLAAKAVNLKVTDNLVAEIDLLGKDAAVTLIRPAYDIQIEKTGLRRVVDHYVQKTKTKTIKIKQKVPYQVTKTVNTYKTTYQKVTKNVPVYKTVPRQVTTSEKFWVDDPPPSAKDLAGGASVAGTTGKWGHWETKQVKKTVYDKVVDHYTQKTVTQKVKVVTGTKQVTKTKYKRVVVGTKTRTITKNVPVYRQEPYTYFETQTIPEQLVEKKTVKLDGVLYVEGGVRKIAGKVETKASIVTNGDVRITGSIVYTDADGNTRMTGGADPTQKYEMNPSYDKNGIAALGIVANGDILYTKYVPANFEINAALISANGTVSMEGIKLDSEGKASKGAGIDQTWVKKSIRRLGGIVSRKRPVATLVDDSNNVIVGFESGNTRMDSRMLLKNGGYLVPPGTPTIDRPMWAFASVGAKLELPGQSLAPVK